MSSGRGRSCRGEKMMGIDKGFDAFEVGAWCDEEGLVDVYCKEAWGGSVGV